MFLFSTKPLRRPCTYGVGCKVFCFSVISYPSLFNCFVLKQFNDALLQNLRVLEEKKI